MLLPSHGVVDFTSTSKLSEASNLANLISVSLPNISNSVQNQRQDGVEFAVYVY